MSQYVDTGEKGFTNGGAAIARYLRVKLDTGAVVVAGDEADIGVTRNYAAAGAPVTVILNSKQGTMPMVASGAISEGAEVFAAAGGKVAAAGTASKGHALHAVTADGDVVEVLPG